MRGKQKNKSLRNREFRFELDSSHKIKWWDFVNPIINTGFKNNSQESFPDLA
jgi:hypothetical protein